MRVRREYVHGCVPRPRTCKLHRVGKEIVTGFEGNEPLLNFILVHPGFDAIKVFAWWVTNEREARQGVVTLRKIARVSSCRLHASLRTAVG